MKTVSIVGFGRFGKVLYEILKDDFTVTLYNRSKGTFKNYPLNSEDKIVKSIKEIYQSEAVFYAVPIAAFENVIASHKKYFRDNLLIDVLSVKLHPKKIFDKHLKNSNIEVLLTHPMFGPDSIRLKGLPGQPMILDKYRTSNNNYNFWKKYFLSKKLEIIELSSKQHDKLAAYSQGVTHFLGRLLQEFDLTPTIIDSVGTNKLNEIMDQTCNDTWELFMNLQNYNPYTKQMRIDLGRAYDRLYNKLLPTRIDKDKISFGIQGGRASFNEEAIYKYIEYENIKHYSIKYLYTTEKVLSALHRGDIDFGIFAIQNSVGGLVEESIQAMTNYKFMIVQELHIRIRHFLMKRPEISDKNITTIMAHPQVFKQCQNTLKQRFPNLKLSSGEGDLIDTAVAAKELSQGNIANNTAILGPKKLQEKYKLKIIVKDLQDDKENLTSFLIVKRKP